MLIVVEKTNINFTFRKTYAGLVYAMDCSVANITTALKEKDMFDDTIVIFISDNGGKILQINKTKIQSNYFNLLLTISSHHTIHENLGRNS